MSNPTETDTILDRARTVLQIEAAAIRGLAARLDDRFIAALALLASCSGRVIVTGMGKSGIIARKIAATLSSTGTAAYFLHPAEAVHGDLGVIPARRSAARAVTERRDTRDFAAARDTQAPRVPAHRHHRDAVKRPGSGGRRDPRLPR